MYNKYPLKHIFTWIHTHTHPFRHTCLHTQMLIQIHPHVYKWTQACKCYEKIYKSIHRTVNQVCIFQCNPWSLLPTKVHRYKRMTSTYICRMKARINNLNFKKVNDVSEIYFPHELIKSNKNLRNSIFP